MTPRTTSSWSIVVLFMTACSGMPELLTEEGQACRSLATPCLEESEALVCDEGVWTSRTCSEICFGEELMPVSCNDGRCDCPEDASGCTPGASTCVQEDEIRWCGADEVWSQSSCSDICGTLPEQPISLGCVEGSADGSGPQGAVCHCSGEGLPCEEESPYCTSATELGRCVQGVWVEESCIEMCSTPTGVCDPGAGAASCACLDDNSQ